MKTILKTLSSTTIVFIAISFSACSDNASFSNKATKALIGATQRIAIDVNCSTPAIVADYVSLESGDTITQELNNTEIITYHDVNGVKKVCLKNGKATIVREAQQ